MSTGYAIEDYLRGFVSYEVPETAMKSILFRVGVTNGTDVNDIEERERDLALAWLYMWCATTPSSKNNTEDSDGGWKHTEGGWQTSAYDKRQMRAMAKDLFDKWGESIPMMKITLINL